ncbi:MAG: DUF177 domain-containing protein [Bacteroidota bacterium]
MIQVDIKSLKPGIHDFEWQPSPEALGLDPDVFQELHVGARVDFHPNRIFVVLETEAEAHLKCDRTLASFTQLVEGEHQVLYSATPSVDGESVDDEVQRIGHADEEIDLTAFVRDTFILSIPARKIAPGADMEEIPLEFGAPAGSEAGIDPRWEALRKLSSDGGEEAAEE